MIDYFKRKLRNIFMKDISYKVYLDKVFGCWLGKSIAGTIGAPFEGRKELFNYQYDPRSIENMLPNDDLDLQVLWLDVIEKKGLSFKTEDLADAFLSKCPYSPGEYQVFKKNYARGIRPPYSGVFNNSYYIDGMGCPIRSEIWACIAPGNPELAAHYSKMDGIMDHGNESVYAEMFLAAMEAAAFFEDDLDKLIDIGLTQIPTDSRTSKLIRDVRKWSKNHADWRFTRELIINNYGHPDCTNMYQNIGITLLALMYCDMEFIDTTMTALNCGYDTDCTCATAGALLGIIYGSEKLIKTYGFKDTTYKLEVDVKRHSNLLFHLAEDTCRVGLTAVEEKINCETLIYDAPKFVPLPAITQDDAMEITVEYTDIPAVGLGESTQIKIRYKNKMGRSLLAKVDFTLPKGWIIESQQQEFTLDINEVKTLNYLVSVPSDLDMLYDRNIIQLTMTENAEKLSEYALGIAGAAVWKMYGPFWDNRVNIPHINYWERYGTYIHGKDENEKLDLRRSYHLNAVADIDKEYLNEPELTPQKKDDFIPPSVKGKIVNTYTDRFSVNELTGLEGPCIIYLERLLYSPEERNVGIQVGNSDPYKLWINGELLSWENGSDWCTNENRHFHDIKFKKGLNRIVVKLSRKSQKAVFSLIFSRGGATMKEHFIDFASKNPANNTST
jgi:ADP-ribosylglycohydrolase